ncbi:MAG: hypothetical protein IJH64_00615 [Oscillospiraceae bacterium]|nr:hypothetical protein [Oscillospiraceae bacterium]
MKNPLMNGGGAAPNQNQMNPQQAIAQIKRDPVGMLKQAGYNVPSNIANDPMAMIQHLVNSGQIPKSRLQAFARK